ncbi:MAG: histidine phosphatase family protein [Thermoleophilia bacterium]|nr:histidine phosphatase family protein [Thermoleophilia bacterium]
MAHILLARHGETDWNLGRRVQGHTDIPLNETGASQATALADELAAEALVAVYSSDLERARDTAMAVAARHGLSVSIDQGLREKNFGTWEGLTDTEISEQFPDAKRGAWGDGETTEAVAERVVAALSRVRQAHPEGLVLVVAHGGPLRAALAHFGVEHGPIGNCEVFRVDG